MYPDVVTARKNSDVEVPLTAQQAEVLDKLLNPAGSLFRVGGRLANLEEAVFDGTSSVEGKSGKTIIVTKTTAGQYASLQAAVDAASSGDVVLVGAGSWGPVTLKAGVSLVGLQPPKALQVVLSSLTFAPDVGATAATNTVYVANLFISSGANATVLTLGGDDPIRAHFSGVRVYRNKADANVPMVVCAGDDATSTIEFENCLFSHEGGQVASGLTLLSTSVRYLNLVDCYFANGGRCLDVTDGNLVVAATTRFETGSTVAALRVGANCTLSLGSCLVTNSGTNASGVELVAGTSTFVASNTGFNVAAGTGKAVLAPAAAGIFVKGNVVANPGSNSSVSAGVTPVALTAI
jgi:hypothetical protein